MFEDTLIVSMYLEFKTPCDRITSNPVISEKFHKEYMNRTGHHVERADLMHHLLNLRRRGQDKGGLPRQFRSYHGRN